MSLSISKSSILAMLLVLFSLAWVGIGLIYSFDLSDTMLPKSDAPGYVTTALFAHHHLVDNGFLYFFWHDVLNSYYWKPTLTPFLLLPALLLTGGKVQLSILCTNLAFLVLLVFPIFKGLQKFTTIIVAGLVTSVLLGSTWLFSDAGNFLSNLPLDLGIFWGLYLWQRSPLRVPFFAALAFCFCIRPIESMIFWIPILIYEACSQLEDGTINGGHLKTILFLFAAEIFSFIAIAKFPNTSASWKSSIWLIGMVIGFVGLYRLRSIPMLQGAVFFIVSTWAWFFTNAQGLIDWIYASTLGDLAVGQGPLNDLSLLQRLNHLVISSGKLPILLLPIASIYLWQSGSAYCKPFLVLLVSICLFPFLSIFSSTHYPIYFHMNYIISFLLTVLFLFLFLDRVIASRALSFAIIFVFSLVFNCNSLREEPRNRGGLALLSGVLGSGEPFWERPHIPVVDPLLDQMSLIPAGKHISVILSYDDVWDVLDVGQLQYRALERRLPYFFNELVHQFSPMREQLSQIPHLGEYILVGPMTGRTQHAWRNLEEARSVYEQIMDACQTKLKPCPIEPSTPIAHFVLRYQNEAKQFALYKVNNGLK